MWTDWNDVKCEQWKWSAEESPNAIGDLKNFVENRIKFGKGIDKQNRICVENFYRLDGLERGHWTVGVCNNFIKF